VINQHKRTDVFRCSQEAHGRFKGVVSVYHVMKEKSCFPQGCLYFLWRCTRLEKGQKCVQGFRHAGKKCGGCTYFADDKVHLQPALLIDGPEYERFLSDLEQYETWLERVIFKKQTLLGRIQTVKPWFEKIVQPGENHTRLRGYLLVFKRGYIGRDAMDDTFYVRISEAMMRQFRFVPKMKVEMTGEIRLDRGRIVAVHPGSVEVSSRGWGFPWTRERALVAVRTASRFDDQPESCLACPWGCLSDVEDQSESEERRFRQLVCLKGVADPEGCYVRMERKLRNTMNDSAANNGVSQGI
jgi:hypothetical protein